jgi:hypothetical protein
MWKKAMLGLADDLVRAVVSELGESMTELGEVFSASTARLADQSVSDKRQIIRDTAADIEPIGVRFERSGLALQQLVLSTDATLRAYVSYILETGTPEEIAEARAELASVRGELEPIRETDQAVADFLEQMRPLEMASAHLRTSLRPLRNGSVAISTAMNLMTTWPDALGDDEPSRLAIAGGGGL